MSDEHVLCLCNRLSDALAEIAVLKLSRGVPPCDHVVIMERRFARNSVAADKSYHRVNGLLTEKERAEYLDGGWLIVEFWRIDFISGEMDMLERHELTKQISKESHE